jgi:hypothetical protein
VAGRSGADSGEDIATIWKAMPRADRATLAAQAARGLRGGNRKDAALMLWWADAELRRGPRPAMKFAAAIVAAVVVVQLIVTGGQLDLAAIFGSSALPIIILIPLATWYFRRPKLQRSRQLNAGYLAGRTFDAPPDTEESRRILARARTKGWLHAPRADG